MATLPLSFIFRSTAILDRSFLHLTGISGSPKVEVPSEKSRRTAKASCSVKSRYTITSTPSHWVRTEISGSVSCSITESEKSRCRTSIPRSLSITCWRRMPVRTASSPAPADTYTLPNALSAKLGRSTRTAIWPRSGNCQLVQRRPPSPWAATVISTLLSLAWRVLPELSDRAHGWNHYAVPNAYPKERPVGRSFGTRRKHLVHRGTCREDRQAFNL